MIISLEFIRAIFTVEEVLFLDPHHSEMCLFIDNLRSLRVKRQSPTMEQGVSIPEFPFALQVLITLLGIVRTYLYRSVAEFLRDASAEQHINLNTNKEKNMLILRENLNQWLNRMEEVGDSIKDFSERCPTWKSGALGTAADKLKVFLEDYSIQLGSIRRELEHTRRTFDDRNDAAKIQLDVKRNKYNLRGMVLALMSF